MARKKKHPEHVNHERWLVSYADFITLLFAFFTTLYAISTVDAKKAGKMVYSMQQAFNVDFFPSKDAILGGTPSAEGVGGKGASGSRASPNIMSSIVAKTEEEPGAGKGDGGLGAAQRMRALMHQVADVISTRNLDTKLKVKIEPQRGLVISLTEAAFFESGEANLRHDASDAMNAIAEILNKAPRMVRVEGHTDDRPIRTARFPSNWDLSSARAVFIVDALVDEYKVPPDQLSAAGYASFRPVDTNDTPEGRSRNRRVDIVLLHEEAAKTEPGADPVEGGDAGGEPGDALGGKTTGFIPEPEPAPEANPSAAPTAPEAPPMTPAHPANPTFH